ncbi:MAG: hypothetical protein BWZ04_03199 [Firmicutes bacterium ADurb.BinA205]|nr:MAG: hypothetical protein BWZ04_03199 [Firmicutes bacterium ADurb.BinA205]
MAYHNCLDTSVYLCLIHFEKFIYLRIGKLRVATVNNHICITGLACAVQYITVCEKVLCTGNKPAVDKSLCVGGAELCNSFEV